MFTLMTNDLITIDLKFLTKRNYVGKCFRIMFVKLIINYNKAIAEFHEIMIFQVLGMHWKIYFQ